METFWIAEYDSRHFTWQGFGKTRVQAVDALINGWNRVKKQYGPDMMTFRQRAKADGFKTSAEFARENFQVYEVKLGGACRDHEEI